MNEKNLLEKTKDFVRSALENAEKGHDWWHSWRVLNNTRLILKTEKADSLICSMSALLHDIADQKFGKYLQGLDRIREFLDENLEDREVRDQILYIVQNISYAGGLNESTPKTPELQVVQDADRLDALGAMGIARAFHYGGYKNREIYNPGIKPVLNYSSSEEYYRSESPTLNHFYEKLLKLKNTMNTPTGKELATHRHRFMQNFLDQFHAEWGAGEM